MSTSLRTALHTETLPSPERAHRHGQQKGSGKFQKNVLKEYRVRGFILEVSHSKKPGCEFA